jgi:predicted MFS family arabinose efflux permease
VQGGIAAFCLLFAVNSAVHSYLILRYCGGDKVSMKVGFYYMSNAAGRLTGTLLSGVLYSYVGNNRVDGFGACFVASTLFCFACFGLTYLIKDQEAGLMCGRYTCIAAQDDDEMERSSPNALRQPQRLTRAERT